MRTRYFQWIAGENAGTVETLMNITEMEGEYFYNFASGESCNLRFISKMTSSSGALRNKFMVEIASPNDPWIATEIKMGKFKNAGDDEIVDVPPLEDITGASGTGNEINVEKSKLGTMKYKAPRYRGPFPELPSLDDYLVEETPSPAPVKKPGFVASMIKKKKQEPQEPVVIETVNPRTVESVEVNAPVTPAPQSYVAPSPNNVARYEDPSDKNDPVKILAKTCKKRETDIDVTLTISLPSKSVYQIAESEFENGGEKFINYLIRDIDVNEIIANIRESLKELYSNSDSE